MPNLTVPGVIEFVRGEGGEPYIIKVYKTDGTLAALAGYTATMKFVDGLDQTSVLVTVGTITVNAGASQLEWAMLATETDAPFAGKERDHIAVIELTSGSIKKRIHPAPIVRVFKKYA